MSVINLAARSAGSLPAKMFDSATTSATQTDGETNHTIPANACYLSKSFLFCGSTRRKWKPNVHWKRLWSASVQDWFRVKVSTNALRCIDKAGGLDNYVQKLKRSALLDPKLRDMHLAIKTASASAAASASE